MEPSQFDDFIKSNSKDELPVPTELSWENMNFTLPKAKRKRRILPWMLFLLIGSVGVGSGLWYVYQRDNTQSQSLPKNNPIAIQSQDSAISLEKESTSVDMARTQDASENTLTRNNVANQETFKKEQLAGIEMEMVTETKTETKTETEEVNLLSLSQDAKSNDLESAKADAPNGAASPLLASAEETSQTPSESLAPCSFLNVSLTGPIRSTSSENHVTLPFDAYNDSQKADQQTKSVALLASIGVNRAQMNHSNPRMHSAEAPDWGNSYQILLEREVKDNWLVSVGLGYQQLHTTFYFEKDLGTYVNFSQGQIIRQTRRVFHNNYFELVSLNVGGGKQFRLSPRLEGQFMMYLSPSHLLSYTGKFLDDSELIVELDPNTVAQNKWLWNADAALRFSYKLNKTDLMIGVNLTQALSKSDFLSGSNAMMTVQPRVFGLNLGIKRTIELRKK